MLNAHYMALRIVSVRRAFTLLVKRDHCSRPLAEIVNWEQGRYVSYTFDDWAEYSTLQRELGANGNDWVRTVRFHLEVPRIIRVLTFSRVPKRKLKFSRRSVFARDDHTCQYCGHRFHASQLSLDHVIPRSQGGATTWENIVCACRQCNVRKGGRTPREAHLRLIRPPHKPARNPTVAFKFANDKYASWRHFLDAANWNVDHS